MHRCKDSYHYQFRTGRKDQGLDCPRRGYFRGHRASRFRYGRATNRVGNHEEDPCHCSHWEDHVIAPITNSDIAPTVIAPTGNNKKYPDVPYFDGEKEKWDKWRFDLDSKFAVLFLTEKEKLDYIRDHCKAIAFDVLGARADPLSEDPYITIKEMISELSSMFGDYDKLAKCSATLHDPAFAMKTKAFDNFYTR